MIGNRTFSKLFKERSHLEHRLQHDVLVDGVAHIPCKVNGIEDIISKFSIKGCESLDGEFIQYVGEFVDFIPVEYPVVLDIYGPEFTPEEQETIKLTISEDLNYLHGKTEDISSRRWRIFIAMIVGTILAGVLLEFAIAYAPNVPRELSYVLFWLFADAVVRYLFLEKVEYERERTCAVRLAKLGVEFKQADKV